MSEEQHPPILQAIQGVQSWALHREHIVLPPTIATVSLLWEVPTYGDGRWLEFVEAAFDYEIRPIRIHEVVTVINDHEGNTCPSPLDWTPEGQTISEGMELIEEAIETAVSTGAPEDWLRVDAAFASNRAYAEQTRHSPEPVHRPETNPDSNASYEAQRRSPAPRRYPPAPGPPTDWKDKIHAPRIGSTHDDWAGEDEENALGVDSLLGLHEDVLDEAVPVELYEDEFMDTHGLTDDDLDALSR